MDVDAQDLGPGISACWRGDGGSVPFLVRIQKGTNMHIGAVVICRLDSSRLPGKALMKIGGKTILSTVVRRCRMAKELEDSVVVATTDRAVDDPIAQHCIENEICVYRGHLDDVAGRALACAESNGFSHFLRVNADSPLVDPGLLSEACSAVRDDAYDIITNLCPRSFPYGVSIELVRTALFRAACNEMTLASHKENVTQFLYQDIHRYRFLNIMKPGEDWSTIRLTVDTQDDFRLFKVIVGMSGESLDSLSYVTAVALHGKIQEK